MTCVSWEPKSRTAIVCAMRSYETPAAGESIPIPGPRPSPPSFFPTRGRLLRPALINPCLHMGIKHRQRQGTFEENLVVKRGQVEFGAQFLLCPVAEFTDFQLSRLVAQSLGGPRHISLDLRHLHLEFAPFGV